MKVLGRWLVKPYPYESGFFLAPATRIAQQATIPVGALGGLDPADIIDEAMSRGFELLVMGRALLADPEVHKDAGRMRDLQLDYAYAQDELAATMEHWEEAAELN